MSNSLKIKYVFGALEIAKRNREGRELEIIKSANRMVEQLENELADKEKQLAEARAEIERKDKLIEQMVGALNHCKNTFEDYVEIHKATMPVVTIGPIPPKWGDIQRKIARNQEAFDLCNAALAAERGE